MIGWKGYNERLFLVPTTTGSTSTVTTSTTTGRLANDWFLLWEFLIIMAINNNLWNILCSFDNLRDAYFKAREHKSSSPEVQEFHKHWQYNLCILMKELKTKTYQPKPLRQFVLRDPKTRLISVSDFRDRVVHHALVNILQPIFEPRFIYDSYASRKGKGTLAALKRFDIFKRKVSFNGRLLPNARNNNDIIGFVLKADIKHYFKTVDHNVLISIMKRKIPDENIIWLIKIILEHYDSGISGKGMPLGNWTSQFFANVYLNELDQFVKHTLKAEFYIRYVDDFVIIHISQAALEGYERQIGAFIRNSLKLELHPDKCRIIPLRQGIPFLGFRIFYHYKLPSPKNIRRIKGRLALALEEYYLGFTDAAPVQEVLQGWSAYAIHGNTFRLRERMLNYIENKL